MDWERWSDTLATTIAGYHPLNFFLWRYVKDKVFSTPVPDITNLKARLIDAFATITEDMLENTWREIGYRLDVLRATKGAHVEVYWCVVKKTSWFTFWKKNVCIPCNFLVINICNQGTTLCSPCRLLCSCSYYVHDTVSMTSAHGTQAENVLQFRSKAKHLIPYQTRRTGDKQNINRTLINFTLVSIYQKDKTIHPVKNLLL